jgi:hypothetical protein
LGTPFVNQGAGLRARPFFGGQVKGVYLQQAIFFPEILKCKQDRIFCFAVHLPQKAAIEKE